MAPPLCGGDVTGCIDPVPPPLPPSPSPSPSPLPPQRSVQATGKAPPWTSAANGAPRASGTAAASPKFVAHHWFLEHAATAYYSSDWTTPLSKVSSSPVCDGCDMDVAFTTRANSRLANFWARLLVLAAEELEVRLQRAATCTCPCMLAAAVATVFKSVTTSHWWGHAP